MRKNKLLLLLALLLTAATGAWAQESATTYSVKMKNGTVDAKNWSIASGEKSVKGDAANGLTGLSEKDAVTLTYTGSKKVLGVKAENKKAAEGHALTSAKFGEIVCSDGKAYAAADKDILPSGVTAAAKVCYVDGNGHGLALALTDEGKMNWSTAQTVCDAHTPAITGVTWKLASKNEWDNMINAAGSYSALRDGFSSVGGTNMQSEGYWSSTEDDSSEAWSYNFGYGYWSDLSKDWYRFVRACLAF